jgi:hypothetical protein
MGRGRRRHRPYERGAWVWGFKFQNSLTLHFGESTISLGWNSGELILLAWVWF